MTWRDEAACKGENPEWWWPRNDSDTNPHSLPIPPQEQVAIAICRHCPVIKECGSYADRNEMSGIWGGKQRFGPGPVRAQQRRRAIA